MLVRKAIGCDQAAGGGAGGRRQGQQLQPRHAAAQQGGAVRVATGHNDRRFAAGPTCGTLARRMVCDTDDMKEG